MYIFLHFYLSGTCAAIRVSHVQSYRGRKKRRFPFVSRSLKVKHSRVWENRIWFTRNSKSDGRKDTRQWRRERNIRESINQFHCRTKVLHACHCTLETGSIAVSPNSWNIGFKKTWSRRNKQGERDYSCLNNRFHLSFFPSISRNRNLSL